MMASNLATVLGHPLLQHKLTLLRQKQTSTAEFRRLAREMSFLMCYEVTRDLPLEMVPIETPLEPMQSPILSGKKLCFVSILRAGNGILEGLLDLVPSARVGHIGLYREPVTLVPIDTTSNCRRISAIAGRSSSTPCWRRATRPPRP